MLKGGFQFYLPMRVVQMWRYTTLILASKDSPSLSSLSWYDAYPTVLCVWERERTDGDCSRQAWGTRRRQSTDESIAFESACGIYAVVSQAGSRGKYVSPTHTHTHTATLLCPTLHCRGNVTLSLLRPLLTVHSISPTLSLSLTRSLTHIFSPFLTYPVFYRVFMLIFHVQ